MKQNLQLDEKIFEMEKHCLFIEDGDARRMKSLFCEGGIEL